MNYRKIILSFVILFYLEMVYHLSIFNVFQIKNILYIMIFTLLTSLFIDMITNLFNHKINKVLFITVFILLALIFGAQFINYKFYGNIVSVYSIVNGGQIFAFWLQILTVMRTNFITMGLFILPIILLLVFHKRILVFDHHFRYLSIKFILLVFTFIICMFALNFDSDQLYSANNIYFHKHVPNRSAQALGIMTTMRLDIERLLIGFEETVEVFAPEGPPIINYGYNVKTIDFDDLIKKTDNKTIRNIHRYMKNSLPSQQNEYTGMFEGKNLIVITAEAFSPIAVHPEITPTIYKLVNNGFKFNNFYAPVYYVSTSDGEYVNLLSLLPKENVWSMTRSANNYFPYAYGNVFKDLGYRAHAFHNWHLRYYNRHLSHPNMGYRFTACGNGLEKLMNCKQWPTSDLEMIDVTTLKYTNRTPFVTYYLTLSGHLEYNFPGNNMAKKNQNAVMDLPYSNAIKAYLATHIELDKALELLIERLEEEGILDDTVIVMATDHYPYGLTTNQMKERMTIENEKFDIHQSNLIIWNSAMEEVIEINKYASTLDILPTVLNLFGVEFDSRLLIGNDLLSSAEGLVIFNDRSWITDFGRYNAKTGRFTPFKETTPENYVEMVDTIVYNKFVISRNILDTDYYKHVFRR